MPTVDCPRCAANHTTEDSSHEKGCPRRKLTVGESFDELTYDEKWKSYSLMVSIKATTATTMEEYSAELYRPRRKRELLKMEIDPHTTTVHVAAERMKAELKKGTQCPCCRQKAKSRPAEVSKRQAMILLLLHKTFAVGSMVHVTQFLETLTAALPGYKDLLVGKEWAQLKHWGLLAEVEPTKELKKLYRETYPAPEGKKGRRMVLHQLTDRGVSFVQGTPVVKTIHVFNDTIMGWDEGTHSAITDVLDGDMITGLWGLECPADGAI